MTWLIGDKEIDPATRAAIVRVSNVIKILATRHIPISDKILDEAYDWLTENDSEPKHVLDADVAEAMVDAITSVYS